MRACRPRTARSGTLVAPPVSPLRRSARWLPFGAALAWLAWQAVIGELRPDLLHLLLAGGAGAAWLAARRLWVPGLLVLGLLTPLAWHFAVALPAARAALAGLPSYLRVEGTVRQREPWPQADGGGARVLLGDASLWSAGGRHGLAELEVVLPGASEWAFPQRSRLRIGGTQRAGAQGVQRVRGRLRLVFDRAEQHREAEPAAWWRGERLQLHLRDRAAYYLSRPALAVYLPVVLGLHERDTPEAREVTGAFRRVGVAHLFAISGLHVSLIFALLLFVQHWGLGWLQRGQGWAYAPAVRRAAVLGAVWAYVALIGFPIPAVRAALMGSLIVWNEQWGTRSPPLYILGLAALLVLAPDPSQLYDVSFQLSFLAYFFLLCALGLHRPLLAVREGGRLRRWARALLEGAWLNVWVTTLITLGLWPLVSVTFGRVSLLVFAGNLVMVPLLGAVVLPVGLAGLAVSLLHAWAAPGAWSERAVFALLDAVLRGWVWIVERLDALSGVLVLPLRPDWPPQAWAAYHGLLLLAIGWAFRRRRGRKAASSAAL
jgi:ComEC/Rec2-related protein